MWVIMSSYYESDPTQSDLDRWKREEKLEQWDEGNDLQDQKPIRKKPVTIHRFATCEKVGCQICANLIG